MTAWIILTEDDHRDLAALGPVYTDAGARVLRELAEGPRLDGSRPGSAGQQGRVHPAGVMTRCGRQEPAAVKVRLSGERTGIDTAARRARGHRHGAGPVRPAPEPIRLWPAVLSQRPHRPDLHGRAA